MDGNINEYRFNDDETDYKLRHEVITKAEYLKTSDGHIIKDGGYNEEG